MNARSESWEVLEWDSGVFGFTVARVLAIKDRDELKSAIESAHRHDARLVYFLTESSELARDAEALGGLFVSERVTYMRDAPHRPPAINHINVQTWRGTTPTAGLIELAREAGRHSRFRVDPRVPDVVFERIYDAWITNSLNGKIADEVMVVPDGPTVSGLVTVGRKQGRADIGLLAVHAHARGRGLGRALVDASLAWGANHGLHAAQVVTQAANVEACRLYESCGYAVERSEHVFHFWE